MTEHEPEQIIQACKNALAKYIDHCHRTAKRPAGAIGSPAFNLAGYAVAALRASRQAAKPIRPSPTIQRLRERLAIEKISEKTFHGK